jgi:hypothetical protein
MRYVMQMVKPLEGSTVMSCLAGLHSKILISAVLVLFAMGADVRAQEALKPWESFDYGKQTIKPAQISSLSLDDLKFLRGIVFGRHGRIFKDIEIKDYLEKQPWYKPNEVFQNSVLNDLERQNR